LEKEKLPGVLSKEFPKEDAFKLTAYIADRFFEGNRDYVYKEIKFSEFGNNPGGDGGAT